MPSSYSTRLRFELIGTGEYGVSGNWGETTNINLGTLIEEAIAGIASVTVIDNATPTALSTANGGTDQARQMILNLTGSLTAQRTVTCPAVQKLYFIRNSTSGGFGVQFKTASGTGVVVPNGRIRAVYCDATNVNDLITDLPSGAQVAGAEIVTTTGTQTLSNKTLTTPRVDTAILDTNGNEALRISATASAVNEVQVVNAAAAGTPALQAFGADTNIGLNLIPKGSGQIFANSLPVVTTTGTQTLTNKTIDSGSTVSNATIANSTTINARDDIFQIQDQADSTKRARFEVSGITAGNTRIITVPDQNYTLGSVLDDTITTSKIVNLNVTTAKIADLNVTTGKIADLNVTTAKIADLNVTTAKIADANVTEVKLASNSVTTAKITDLNVTEGKLADGSVTVNKIGAGAVTVAKLAQPLTSAGALTLTGVATREWTGIPAWVRRITISMADVTYASGFAFVRLGTSGGYVTTNTYYWDSWNSGWVGGSPMNSFKIAGAVSSSDISGHFTITYLNGTTWVASYIAVIPNVGPYLNFGAGYLDVGGALERVQFSNTGAINFGSGVVSLMYE